MYQLREVLDGHEFDVLFISSLFICLVNRLPLAKEGIPRMQKSTFFYNEGFLLSSLMLGGKGHLISLQQWIYSQWYFIIAQKPTIKVNTLINDIKYKTNE